MRQPRRWLAVVLSLLSAGLGHVYCGYVARALFMVALVQVFAIAMVVLFAAGPVSLALLGLVGLAAAALNIGIAVDAARTARRGRRRFLGRPAIVAACLGFWLFLATLGLGLELLRERNLGEPFRIPSGGMFPTLLVGDQFFTHPMAYRLGEPERGDVVVFTIARRGYESFPADRRSDLPRERFAQRIVGLPGDRIAFDGAALLVNGVRRTGTEPAGEFVDDRGRTMTLLTESLDGREYRILDDPGGRLPDREPVVVEEGRYFLAGDNRDHSKDSRTFGTIAREHLLGPTSSIYWSWDFNGSWGELLNPVRLAQLLRTNTRWHRIGTPTN